jgi:chromosome segregation ATPase
VQPSIDTASDTSDQSLTIELTLALEKIGILQNKVTSLEDDTFVLQSQLNKAVSEKNTLQNEITELHNHISVITQERDYFEEQWGNWKAVAMEQIRVMIDVLGL